MKNEKIGFRLSRISTEQFAILQDNFQSDNAIKIGLGIKFGKMDAENIVGVFTAFQFEQDGKPFELGKRITEQEAKLTASQKQNIEIPELLKVLIEGISFL